MGSVLNSLDNMLASAYTNGLLVRSIYVSSGSSTAATTSSGYTTHQRLPNQFIVPSLGTGITGVVFPNIKLLHSNGNTPLGMICGLETLLGTVTANGGSGSFSAGSVMPTKTIRGTSIVTAASCIFAVVTTVMVGAGTYTLTITYTDQNGNTGNTATLTIPNVAAVNSAFAIAPHLANGDTGIREVTGITLTGTTGVIKIYGLLPLQTSVGNGQSSGSTINVPLLSYANEMWPAVAGDILAFYSYGGASGQILAMLVGVADS